MTHICVSKLTIIGSDNGLSPERRQAIIWTNAGILLIGPLGTNFSEILTGIQTFSFKKMHLKMSSAKWRPFCLGLDVLRYYRYITLDIDSPWNGKGHEWGISHVYMHQQVDKRQYVTMDILLDSKRRYSYLGDKRSKLYQSLYNDIHSNSKVTNKKMNTIKCSMYYGWTIMCIIWSKYRSGHHFAYAIWISDLILYAQDYCINLITINLQVSQIYH